MNGKENKISSKEGLVICLERKVNELVLNWHSRKVASLEAISLATLSVVLQGVVSNNAFQCGRLNYKLTSLKENRFNTGFHWNLFDGKSPHTCFFSEGSPSLGVSLQERICSRVVGQ